MKRSKGNDIGSKVLSSYEIGILRGMRKRKSDEQVEALLTQEKLKKYLGCEISIRLADGTEVTSTAEEFIIASAISDAISKGSFEKMKTMMQLKGELDTSTNVVVNSKVDEDLLRRALGSEEEIEEDDGGNGEG